MFPVSDVERITDTRIERYALAGATSVQVRTTPEHMAGEYLLIDPGAHAEIVQATRAENRQITFSPALVYDHAEDAPVVRVGASPVVAAEMFGLDVGDTLGVSNTMALHRALDTLSALGGGTLLVDQIYTVDGTFTWSDAAQVRMIGKGSGISGFKLPTGLQPTATAWVLRIDGSNLHLDGLVFDASGVFRPRDPVYPQPVEPVPEGDIVDAGNSSLCILSYGGSNVSITRCKLTGAKSQDGPVSGGDCIYLRRFGRFNWVIDDCDFVVHEARSCVVITNGDGVTIRNSRFTGDCYNSVFDIEANSPITVEADSIRDVTFANNHADVTGAVGFGASGKENVELMVAKNIRIENNTFILTKRFGSVIFCEDVTIVNNHVRARFPLDAPREMLQITWSNRIFVSGLTMVNESATGVASPMLAWAETTNLTMENITLVNPGNANCVQESPCLREPYPAIILRNIRLLAGPVTSVAYLGLSLSSNGMILDGLYSNLPAYNGTGGLLHLLGAQGIIRDVVIEGAQNAFYYGGSGDTLIDGVVISGATGQYPMRIANGNRLTISNVSILGCTGTGATINIRPASNVSVLRDVVVENCRLINSAGGGIYLGADPAATTYVFAYWMPITAKTVDSATNDTLTDAGVQFINSYPALRWVGAHVLITSGTDAGDEREIVSYTNSVLTVASNWTTNPDATSVYSLVYKASAGGATTLTDAGVNFLGAGYPSFLGASVRIISGTGANQVRQIMSYTATVLTVSPPWTTNPDNTSTYEIGFYPSNITFQNCVVSGHTSAFGFNIYANVHSVVMRRCLVSSNYRYGVVCKAAEATFSENVFEPGISGAQYSGILLAQNAGHVYAVGNRARGIELFETTTHHTGFEPVTPSSWKPNVSGTFATDMTTFNWT